MDRGWIMFELLRSTICASGPIGFRNDEQQHYPHLERGVRSDVHRHRLCGLRKRDVDRHAPGHQFHGFRIDAKHDLSVYNRGRRFSWHLGKIQAYSSDVGWRWKRWSERRQHKFPPPAER